MRGMALLGIFIMNLPSMGRSFFEPDGLAMQRIGDYGAVDHAVFMLSLALLEGKFNGLWERLGPLACTVLAVAMYALIQLPLARWWLARHPMGPAEALWRRISYSKPAAGRGP